MGRFNKLINAFGNMPSILEGIKNKVFTKEDVEEVAAIRWGICDSCQYVDHVGTHCVVPGSQPCCSDCGCILSLKIRSMSAECPKGKWSAFMSEDDEKKLKDSLE
ncbi:hypothetical protein N9L94_00950 [Robiginitalea sp.]|nr:hypothetical protein [Robiginitalea sp.]|tara:strand:- start:56 stop:370 length:315 start_codon:yes stop_codon:yes gene_type:complete